MAHLKSKANWVKKRSALTFGLQLRKELKKCYFSTYVCPCQTCWVEIPCRDNSSLLTGTFYFRPGLSVTSFSEQMNLLSDKLHVQNYCILILGDFNVSDKNWDLKHTSSSSRVTLKANTLLDSINLARVEAIK